MKKIWRCELSKKRHLKYFTELILSKSPAMSYSKPLPPFTYELLCFWNRDQLERFAIVCRSLKNFTERYFHSKPNRIFDCLWIGGGSYTLTHNGVRWQPNRDDYSTQQFLAGQTYQGMYIPWNHYSFAEMRPYLGPTVRINKTTIVVAGDATLNPEHIDEMESLAYLWRNSEIHIGNYMIQIGAERFQPILNSPTILQCRKLIMTNAHFPFKDYKVLYTMKVIEIHHNDRQNIELWQQYWQHFLEQPGVKPVLVLWVFFDILLDRLSQDFSSAVVPNAFKVVFVRAMGQTPLTEFCETNKTSNEKLELKKGLPVECRNEDLDGYVNYTLERSTF